MGEPAFQEQVRESLHEFANGDRHSCSGLHIRGHLSQPPVPKSNGDWQEVVGRVKDSLVALSPPSPRNHPYDFLKPLLLKVLQVGPLVGLGFFHEQQERAPVEAALGVEGLSISGDVPSGSL